MCVFVYLHKVYKPLYMFLLLNLVFNYFSEEKVTVCLCWTKSERIFKWFFLL